MPQPLMRVARRAGAPPSSLSPSLQIALSRMCSPASALHCGCSLYFKGTVLEHIKRTFQSPGQEVKIKEVT